MCAPSEDEGYFNILQLIPSQSRMKILAIDNAQIRKEVKLKTQQVKKIFSSSRVIAEKNV